MNNLTTLDVSNLLDHLATFYNDFFEKELKQAQIDGDSYSFTSPLTIQKEVEKIINEHKKQLTTETEIELKMYADQWRYFFDKLSPME